TDKDGNPRIVGGTVDMGAYENQVIQLLTISGKVTKADGITPISGALVKVLQVDVVKAETTTGADGNYTLWVPSGTETYKFNVSCAGYITQILPHVSVNSGTMTTSSFALLSGKVVVFDEFEQASLDTNKWEMHLMNNGSVGIGTETYPDETFKSVRLDTRYPGGPDSAAITSKATATVAMDKVIFDSRISVYEEWGNVYGDGQPRGLRVGTDPNNAIEFISTGNYGIQARSVSGGIPTTTNYSFGGSRTRIIYRIEATANQVKFFVNGNQIATHTTNIPTGALNVYMSSHDGGAGNVPVNTDYLLLGTATFVSKTSPADNLALHADTSASDDGWGGGSSKTDLTDGIRTYDGEWARGLAFQKGWSQVTMDFGKTIAYDRVMAWWHGGQAESTYCPQAYRIENWNGTSWVEIFSTTNPSAYLKYPYDGINWWSGWSAPTENTFSPVTGSKVRLWSYPKDGEVMAGYHVWLYEVEVYSDAGSTPVSATLQIVPASGTVGTVVTISGTGYSSGETVKIAFGTNVSIQTAVAGQNGSFTTTFTVDTQVYGTTSITASGVSAVAVNAFSIQPQVVSVLPTSGTVGTVVTISGNGFCANELISINMGTTVSIAAVTSGVNGTFTTAFVVDSQSVGTKTVGAYGLITGRDACGFFVVTAPLPVTVYNASGGFVGAYAAIQ
ncbi:MAG: carboxypeptidase regulatory-like domain-containing protein, partial [Candidatus Desantisbacteria bacterium]